MGAVFIRTIKNRWRMLLALCLIAVSLEWMYIALFPSYSQSFAGAEELFEQMPEALKQAFNLDSLSFDTIEKFLNLEMYSFFWPILSVLFALSLAGSAWAGEVEQETIQLTAGQPLSRTSMWFGKWLAAAAMLTVFVIIVSGVALPLSALHGIEAQAGNFFTIGVMCEFFALGLLGMASAVSAWMSEKARVYFILSGLLLVMYALNIVSGLRPSLDGLKYATIFHYFNSYRFLVENSYEATAIGVFLGLALVGTALGWYRWTRRDVA